MQIRYIGPFADGVEIAETGEWADRMKWVEVEPELGRRLLEQSVWESKRPQVARKARKPRKPRKAAARKAVVPEAPAPPAPEVTSVAASTLVGETGPEVTAPSEEND